MRNDGAGTLTRRAFARRAALAGAGLLVGAAIVPPADRDAHERDPAGDARDRSSADANAPDHRAGRKDAPALHGLDARLAGSRLELRYRLPRAQVEGLGPRPHEATLVVAVSALGTPPACCDLVGRNAPSPPVVRAVGDDVEFDASVEVTRLLDLPTTPARYFVHASFLHYRSPVLLLRTG